MTELFTQAVVPDTSRLEELESVIERGLETFIDVGAALLEIRDSGLYKHTYNTFENYCRERWGMVRRQADRLIEAAEVTGNLRPMGLILPTNERQARPLASLEPDEQREVWQRVIEKNEKITAEVVQKEVDIARAKQAMEITTYSHNSLEYYTPSWVLEAARKVLGDIDLDPASCEDAQKNVKASTYYTLEDDGLSKPWFGHVWLNPPYSKTEGRSNQDIWSERLVNEYKAGNVTEAILLVKAALGYKWFEELFDLLPVCLLRERLSFILDNGSDDGQSKQGTALFYLGDNFQLFYSVFKNYGRVIPPTKELDALLKQ